MNTITLRRFVFVREADRTGYSGTGVVLEGVQFSDGRVVCRWLGDKSSIVIWPNMQMALDVHGHGGDTVLHWVDDEDGAPAPVQGGMPDAWGLTVGTGERPVSDDEWDARQAFNSPPSS